MRARPTAAILYWSLTGVFFVVAMVMMVVYAPVESTMGVVQKIFYLHLPVAINTLLGAAIVFVASVGYLWTRDTWWDDLAAAACRMTILFCAVLLMTGMIWARSAWGMWWTWSPRLTFSLVLLLLYVVYLLLRPTIESQQRRALVCAVYGIAAFVDVPVVFLSVRLIPDIHPTTIALAPEMRLTLLVWMVPVTMLMAGNVHTVYRRNRDRRSATRSEFDEDATRMGVPA